IAGSAAARKRAHAVPSPELRFMPVRAAGKDKGKRSAPPTISARLSGHITLDTHPDGRIAARFEGQSVGLGTFGAGAVQRASELRTGLPLGSFSADGSTSDKDVDLLVRRLARSGLLEYCLGSSRRGNDLGVIEPQIPDYWPGTPELADPDRTLRSRCS